MSFHLVSRYISTQSNIDSHGVDGIVRTILHDYIFLLLCVICAEWDGIRQNGKEAG